MPASEVRPSHVIRQHAPVRTYVFSALIILLLTLLMYIVYETGRFNAGYDRQAASQQRGELEIEIEHLTKSNHELRTHLAELDTIRIGRSREQAEVSRTIGELQGQLAKADQELAFYRNIVAQGATAVGVKVQQVNITAGSKPQRFILHVALVRTGRPDAEVGGSLSLTLDGTATGGAATMLDMPALTPGKLKEVTYHFQYFQNLEQEVTLPAGYRPEKLSIEIRSNKKDVAPASQSFPWAVNES